MQTHPETDFISRANFSRSSLFLNTHIHIETHRRREGEGDYFSREVRLFGRASVVWGDEAKNGSIPPTRGLRVREQEREREKRRDK